MSNHLPLTEVGGSEVIARTVYQIILMDYRENPQCYDNPTTRLLDLSLQWKTNGIFIIAEELGLVAIWCGQGSTVRAWLSSRCSMDAGRTTRLARAGSTRRR